MKLPQDGVILLCVCWYRRCAVGYRDVAELMIDVDKYPRYVQAVRDLKRENLLPEMCKRRPSQYKYNIINQFLVAAFIVLYFLPDESGQRFAWQINPAMTAAWMGAGYLGGAYFFVRVLLGKRWHRILPGFRALTAFTWAMLVATPLHWSRFDLGHRLFQIWLVLYVVTPFPCALVVQSRC